MKNRESIKFQRTDKGFIGSLKTADTFIIARGFTKKDIKREIKGTLQEF